MKKLKLRPWVIYLFIIICLSGLIFSVYKIFNWKKATDDNKKIINKIDKYIIKEDDNITVDFDKLKEQNSDTVAYLSMNNTKINYVVVQTDNNDYYLNHNFDKKKNEVGWIFLDYRNNLDSDDRNTIIYGHNTADGSMFGSLKKLFDKKYSKEDLELTLITPNGARMYEIFSFYSIPVEDYYITTSFDSDKEYLDYLYTVKKRSIYNYDVKLTKDDRVLTLSTCTAAGAKRVVLHARLIKGD